MLCIFSPYLSLYSSSMWSICTSLTSSPASTLFSRAHRQATTAAPSRTWQRTMAWISATFFSDFQRIKGEGESRRREESMRLNGDEIKLENI